MANLLYFISTCKYFYNNFQKKFILCPISCFFCTLCVKNTYNILQISSRLRTSTSAIELLGCSRLKRLKKIVCIPA